VCPPQGLPGWASGVKGRTLAPESTDGDLKSFVRVRQAISLYLGEYLFIFI